MNFRITSAWGAVSAIGTLIALYLFLSNSEAAGNLFRDVTTSGNRTIGVLQGRTAKVANVR